MTKFDIKIKLNEMIREEIELKDKLKEDKKPKINSNQKNKNQIRYKK